MTTILRSLQGNDNHQQHDDKTIVLKNSKGFQIGLATLLCLIIIVRTYLLYNIWKLRKKTTLQLAQPFVISIVIVAGTITLGSCYLLIPFNDTSCLLKEPFVLTPLTFVGCVLVGRIWRISIIMNPVLQIGKNASQKKSILGSQDYIKNKIMDTLTCLSTINMLSIGYGMKNLHNRCCVKKRNNADSDVSSNTFLATGTNRRPSLPHRTSTGTMIRQKIPVHRLLRLILFLIIPQAILQICNLTVASMKQRKDTTSIDYWSSTNNSVMTNQFDVRRESCERITGRWPTWIGLALALIPYCLTLFLSMSTDHLPDVFNEAEAMKASSRLFLLIAVTAGTTLTLAETPDARVFLQCCMVSGVIFPPVWFIVWNKVASVWKETEKAKGIGRIQELLKKTRRDSMDNLKSKEDHGTEKAATLALTIGKMYEDMGYVQKSIVLFDEALELWKWDANREKKDLVGEFTLDEINSFTAKDLEFIIQLNIAKGRVNGTFNSSVNTGQKNAAQAWLDALEIYESCPASIDMNDRSIIFPIFSGLFVFLKGGKISQDKYCTFEKNLVKKFVRETKLHGDPVHYSRALAMECEVKARLGDYTGALKAFETLKNVYDPEEHSSGISNAYGTDRSAQAYSQSALWYLQLGDDVKALDSCEYVIRHLMPMMDPKNVLNSCEMLLPVIRIYKLRGQALLHMKELFDEYVVQNFNRHFGKDGVTPCLPMFKPMLLLLDISHDSDNFEEFHSTVEWLCTEEENSIPEFLDSVYTKLCWSPFSLLAELCLRLAKKINDDNTNDDADSDFDDKKEKYVALIEKGMILAQKADKKMKDEEGEIILPIAYEIHEPVYTELLEIANELNLQCSTDSMMMINERQSKIIPDPKNLPKSYLQRKNDSSDNSSSNNNNSLLFHTTGSSSGHNRTTSNASSDNSSGNEFHHRPSSEHKCSNLSDSRSSSICLPSTAEETESIT